MKKITNVFFIEAITWPATKYSGSVSFDVGKPGFKDMWATVNDSGVYIEVETNNKVYTLFVPMPNVRCVNYGSVDSAPALKVSK